MVPRFKEYAIVASVSGLSLPISLSLSPLSSSHPPKPHRIFSFHYRTEQLEFLKRGMLMNSLMFSSDLSSVTKEEVCICMLTLSILMNSLSLSQGADVVGGGG